MTHYFHLKSRGVVQLTGEDALGLLNGLVTNELDRATPSEAVFAAMLTPQGKYLFDMFVVAPEPNVLLLDVARADVFAKRLLMYRLRSKVQITDVSDQFSVVASTQPIAAVDGAHIFKDPRLPELGWCGIVPQLASAPDNEDLYQQACHERGVPDLQRDLLVEKDFALEGLLDELNGVDFHKGCYVGQEMTSRMKRRTTVKNKLCRVRYAGSTPPFDAPIMADGWEVGRMRSGSQGVGIALLRFDRVAQAQASDHVLLAEGAEVTPDAPEWLVRPNIV